MALFRWRSLVAAALALPVLLLARPARAEESRPQGVAPRPPTPTGVVINLPARTLYWYVDGKLVRAFPVAIGKTNEQTPVGSYRVQNKAVHPWWQPPGGGPVVPPGPQNPLGTRWIGFNGGYGIHGNNNPASIGGIVSLGCVRMYIPDVEWLYEQVRVGTPVTVTYQPVQVSYGSDGRRFLAIYPDLYGKGSPSVGSVLQSAGIEPDAATAKGQGLYPLDAGAVVNGMSIEAIMHGGRPYVQARTLAAKLGAPLGWDAASRKVSLDGQALPTAVRGGTGYVDAEAAAILLGVEYEWNSKTGTVWLSGRPLFLNGHLAGRDAKVIDGQVYLPVRTVAEAAGATVDWDAVNRKALINGQAITSVLIRGKSYARSSLMAQWLSVQITESDGILNVTW